MAIRLRQVENTLIALCAAMTTAKPGDIYLDDAAHHALGVKFALDWESEGILPAGLTTERERTLIDREESDRMWWDEQYGI